MSTQIRTGAKAFYDDIRFPRGFNRSGEFSIAESQILNTYGHTLKGLHDGILMPENNEEKQFILVVNGAEAASTLIEKTWCKYLKTAMPREWHTLNGRNKTPYQTASSEYDLEL